MGRGICVCVNSARLFRPVWVWGVSVPPPPTPKLVLAHGASRCVLWADGRSVGIGDVS